MAQRKILDPTIMTKAVVSREEKAHTDLKTDEEVLALEKKKNV